MFKVSHLMSQCSTEPLVFFECGWVTGTRLQCAVMVGVRQPTVPTLEVAGAAGDGAGVWVEVARKGKLYFLM